MCMGVFTFASCLSGRTTPRMWTMVYVKGQEISAASTRLVQLAPPRRSHASCFRPSPIHPPTVSSQIMEDRRSALAKQREAAHADYESKKKQLVAETEKARPSSHRFVGQNDSVEDSLKRQTVGLVHLEDFQARRKEIEEERARAAAKSDSLK